MEKKDEDLIQQLMGADDELRRYYEEHVELEKQLDELNRHLHLSAEKEFERKQLQKRKLAGKDRIMEILGRHRSSDGTANA